MAEKETKSFLKHDSFKEKFKYYKKSRNLSGVINLTVKEDLSSYNVRTYD